MPLRGEIHTYQAKLLLDIHGLWSRLPIPDWPVMKGGFEEAELSQLLSGRSYRDTFQDQYFSESVFIWCRPDVATYYLGGHLLYVVDLLIANPYCFCADCPQITLQSFIEGEGLYRNVYDYILENVPDLIPIVSSYGRLLQLSQEAGPPEKWLPGRAWPIEREAIERILAVWRDRATFAAVVGQLQPVE
jgi:hypothetical protein